MRNIGKIELGVRVGLKLFDIITDLMINRKSKITYCPVCKKYREGGAIWIGEPKDLKGYELAKTIICDTCKRDIEALKVKIEITRE